MAKKQLCIPPHKTALAPILVALLEEIGYKDVKMTNSRDSIQVWYKGKRNG